MVNSEAWANYKRCLRLLELCRIRTLCWNPHKREQGYRWSRICRRRISLYEEDIKNV